MQVEMAAALHSLTMAECKHISTTHRTPNARAKAGGKLIERVMQQKATDQAHSSQRAAPPMPTLLGGAGGNAAAGPPGRGSDALTHDGRSRLVDTAAPTTEEQQIREQREQEAAEWRRQQHESEQQLETHAHELQQQLQDQQNLRHAQQQQRQQQQDEESHLEQQRQKLEQQRQQLQQHQQQLSQELHLQLQQQQQAQQHPPTRAAAAPNAHHGQPQHPQPHAAQPGPHTITTQQQTYPPHHGQTAQPPAAAQTQTRVQHAAGTARPGHGGLAFGATQPMTVPLPTRVDTLMTGTAQHEWASELLTMAGTIPGSTMQTDLLRTMSTEDVARIVDGFLEKANQTADTCRPPAGMKAFQYFWRIASDYTTEREARKGSVSAQSHADKSAGKLLEKSTSEAAHSPTHTVSASVYSDQATITALKQFTGTNASQTSIWSWPLCR